MTDNTLEFNNGAGQKRSELAVPSDETIEFPLPYLKIPNGYPEDDKMRRVLNAENEPSEEVLKEFFTPDAVQRLVYCPQINRDMTDDWGMFGYEPGYLFVCGRNYEGAHTLADEGVLKAITTEMIKTASGVELMTIPHYDYFPRHKFMTQGVTAERTPRTFAFLRKILENVDPNDISTYPADDLYHEFEGLRSGFRNKLYFLEMAEKFRKIANDESLPPKRRQEALIDADRDTQFHEKAQEQTPKNIERYLLLVSELQGRKEITNPSAVQLFGSFKDEQISIQAAIEQAKQRGDNELANAIEKLQGETGSYREGRMYLLPKTNKKPPELNSGK